MHQFSENEEQKSKESAPKELMDSQIAEFSCYALIIPLLIWLTWRVVRRPTFHINFRINLASLSASVLDLLLVRCAILATNAWGDRSYSNLTFCLEQLGFIWYRASYFTFILERFICARNNKDYERRRSAISKALFIALTLALCVILYCLFISLGSIYGTFSVIWIVLVQIATIPMTIYVLLKTRNDWRNRHVSASLSQRFQLSEAKLSARIFVPLVVSNFGAVSLLTLGLAIAAYGNLSEEGVDQVYAVLDWIDFYQRMFFTFCLAWAESDGISKGYAYLKRKLTLGAKTEKVCPHQASQDEMDTYFKNLHKMWA